MIGDEDLEMTVLQWPEPLTDDAVAAICAANPDLRIERSTGGELIVMPPSSLSGGAAEAELVYQLQGWARINGGRVFSPTAGFSLPNAALRSPDAAYLSEARWLELAHAERQRFAHVVPDAAFEIRSRTDALRDLTRKVEEYVACGVRLVVLLDPARRVVEIRRPGQPPEILDDPETIAFEAPLDRCTLDVHRIFELANE